MLRAMVTCMVLAGISYALSSALAQVVGPPPGCPTRQHARASATISPPHGPQARQRHFRHTAPRCPATPTPIAPPGDLARRSARPRARGCRIDGPVAERRSQGARLGSTSLVSFQEPQKGTRSHDDRDEADGDRGGDRAPSSTGSSRVGARAHPSRGEEVTVIGAIGDREHVARLELDGAPGRRPRRPDPQALQARLDAVQARRAHRARHRRAQDRRRALRAHRRAVHRRVARPDARRPRRSSRRPAPRCSAAAPTSRARRPYAFQGLGQEGLRLLAEAKARDRPADRHRADGRARPRGRCSRWPTSSRSARATCRTTRCWPRSAARAARCCSSAGCRATLEELLMAAEYILKEGNEEVMLCERGIRTFETAYRFTLDLTAVPGAQGAQPPAGDRRPQPRRRAGATSSSRCRSPPPRPAPTASSSRSTRRPSEAICDGPQALRADDFAAYAAARRRRPPRSRARPPSSAAA